MGTGNEADPEDLPAPPSSSVSPDLVRSYRWQLTPGEDVIDPATFAGSIPQVNGIAPRVRVGRSKWFNLLWLLPIGFLVLIVAVAVAKELRSDPSVQDFIEQYPGTVEPSRPEATTGFPAWVRWQHFFNLFLLIFIIRSGVQILSDHPRLYWTRHCTPGTDWFRIQRPVPPDPLWTAKQDSISLPGQVGLPGLRHSIGLARWWHLSVDALWLLNGVIFFALLFATDRWQRLVPTSWDVFPNALSVLIQYLSLNWPTDDGFVAYNGLQLIAYFITVFVAAPLALITGLGMSPALSTRFKRVSTIFSIQTARSLHFLVLVWFLVFIASHVFFVFTTDLLVNLNHVYAGRTDDGWGLGFWLFAESMVVVVGWVAATPFTIRHPRVVQRAGQVLPRRRSGQGHLLRRAPDRAHESPPHDSRLRHEQESLPFGHGAPLRLRNEIELGFKQVKWIKGIEFVAHYTQVGGGYGGYNQDHEFFGYRQSI
jgi:sulfoxide reductase catalytic subunit YedY